MWHRRPRRWGLVPMSAMPRCPDLLPLPFNDLAFPIPKSFATFAISAVNDLAFPDPWPFLRVPQPALSDVRSRTGVLCGKRFCLSDDGDAPMSRDVGDSATLCLHLSARNPTRLLRFCCKQTTCSIRPRDDRAVKPLLTPSFAAQSRSILSVCRRSNSVFPAPKPISKYRILFA
jgi:hypothetical protein